MNIPSGWSDGRRQLVRAGLRTALIRSDLHDLDRFGPEAFVERRIAIRVFFGFRQHGIDREVFVANRLADGVVGVCGKNLTIYYMVYMVV